MLLMKTSAFSADPSGDEASAGAVSISARSASQSPAALRIVVDELDALIAGNALHPAPSALKQVGHTLNSIAHHGSYSRNLSSWLGEALV